MWLMTRVGFFSIVRKPGDGDPTIRSRVREDLEALQQHYLPALGPITAKAGTDYPFRAKASVSDVAAATARMIDDIDVEPNRLPRRHFAHARHAPGQAGDPPRETPTDSYRNNGKKMLMPGDGAGATITGAGT